MSLAPLRGGVLRWVPGRIPLALHAPGKAVDGIGANCSNSPFPEACNGAQRSGRLSGTQCKDSRSAAYSFFRQGLSHGEAGARFRRPSCPGSARASTTLPGPGGASSDEAPAARTSSLPRSRSEWRGGPTRAKPERGGGRFPRRFVDDKARLSMAALAQPPHHPRRPRAWPSHPPPLPLPATRLRRAGGGRSEVGAQRGSRSSRCRPI